MKKINKKKEKKILLTGSNDCSTTGTRLSASSAQGQEIAQPAQGNLLAVTVKVGGQGAGRLEFAQLASIRRVTDGQNGLEPARAGCDGTTVHPNIETGAASVGTVATLTNTTEGQGWDVEGSVVARDTPGAGGVQN
jgi:hypothetical protein